MRRQLTSHSSTTASMTALLAATSQMCASARAQSSASTTNLSDVTIQFRVFCSVHAVDAATGLPFPYHMQRVLDRTVADKLLQSNKNSNNNSSATRVEPGTLKWWVDSDFALAQDCKRTDDEATVAAGFGDVEVDLLPWSYSAVSSASHGDGGVEKKKEQKGAVNKKKNKGVSKKKKVSVSDQRPDETMKIRHFSCFEAPPPPSPPANGEKTLKDKNNNNNNNNNKADTAAAAETDKPAPSPQERLLASLRCRGGTPRDGQTGAFFTRQDLAFPLARSAQRHNFTSPFWIPQSHPGLAPEARHLKLRSDCSSDPTTTGIHLVVFPAKRLMLGHDAAQRILSPSFLAAKGSAAAAGMNAVSGSVVSAGGGGNIDFFRDHPDFAKDGWVSYDQIMKLGLPLVASSSSGSSSGSSAVTDLFDGGVLVEVFRQSYFNADQLEKPGRLAMRNVPGAPRPLMEKVVKN